MKNLKQRRIIAAAIIGIIVLLTGCAPKTAEKQILYYEGGVNKVSGGIIAENKNYSLEWDAERTALLLHSKAYGGIFGTVPYGFYSSGVTSGKASVELTSPINISYIDSETLSVKTVSGSTGVIKNGRVASEKIEDGIKITYYFDKLKISVPVEYTLFDEGLEAKIIVGEISESDYHIYQISLLPYMVSAVNSETSYLAVPSGSGGIIKTANAETVKTYSEELYGNDPVKVVYSETASSKQSRLPVFGSCDGENSILAVIGEGASSAAVEAKAANPETGYSGAYAKFYLRGYDLTNITDHSGAVTYIKKYSSERISADCFSVRYYPMNGYSKDYSGMASLYRDILIRTGKLSADKENSPAFALEILGGAKTKKLFLGFPYNTTEVATSFSEALSIVKELTDETGEKFLIKMSGFTDGGLDAETVGGGFKPGKSFGGGKKFLQLADYCRNAGNKLFVDYDIVRFSKSGNGFSSLGDSVKTANLIRSKYRSFNVALNTYDGNSYPYYLLSPRKLTKAADKLISAAAELELCGVSLGTLGSTAYSDYSYTGGYCKGDISKQASAVISKISRAKLNVLTSDANEYAALASDYITNVPLKSSRYDCIDRDIPFYEMVFKGYIPLYSSPINAEDDPNTYFLKMIECGVNPGFSVCCKYPEGLFSTSYSIFSTSRYDTVKSKIKNILDISNGFLKSVNDSGILRNERQGNLAHTVFENGISIYVNYGNTAVNTPLGKVEARSFIYGGE